MCSTLFPKGFLGGKVLPSLRQLRAKGDSFLQGRRLFIDFREAHKKELYREEETVARDHQAADTQEVIVRGTTVVEFFLMSLPVLEKPQICSRRSTNHSELFFFKERNPQPRYGSYLTFSLCTENHNIKTVLYSSPEGNRLFRSDAGRSECGVTWIWEGCRNLPKNTNNPGVRFYGQRCVLIGVKQQRASASWNCFSPNTHRRWQVSLRTMRPTVTCHCH